MFKLRAGSLRAACRKRAHFVWARGGIIIDDAALQGWDHFRRRPGCGQRRTLRRFSVIGTAGRRSRSAHWQRGSATGRSSRQSGWDGRYAGSAIWPASCRLEQRKAPSVRKDSAKGVGRSLRFIRSSVLTGDIVGLGSSHRLYKTVRCCGASSLCFCDRSQTLSFFSLCLFSRQNPGVCRRARI